MIYIAILALIVIALYFFLIFPTQWLKVERVSFAAGLGIKVLQISDLHVEKIRISAKRIQRLIQIERPSYIVLTGDFTQNGRYLSKVQRYIHAIASEGIPVFAVLGNHDHRLKQMEMDKLTEMFKAEGVELLSNRHYDCGKFQIVGIDDWGTRHSKEDKAFQKAAPNKPTIVLSHDPNFVLHMKRKYTYLMAGHFHGMQFNIPFLFRFINKGKLAANGIYKGMHTVENGTFYISKGISQAGPNARFLIRSEVTLHEL